MLPRLPSDLISDRVICDLCYLECQVLYLYSNVYYISIYVLSYKGELKYSLTM